MFTNQCSPARPMSTRRSSPSKAARARDGVLDVEAEVAREMVPRPERDAHEGPVFLRGDAGDRRERAVPSRHADRARRFAGQSRGIVLLREEMDV